MGLINIGIFLNIKAIIKFHIGTHILCIKLNFDISLVLAKSFEKNPDLAIDKLSIIWIKKAYLGLLKQDNKYFWTILKYKDNKISITYYNKGEKTEDLNKKTITLYEYFKTFIDSSDYLFNIHKPNFEVIDENEKKYYNECYKLLKKYRNIFKNKYTAKEKIETFFNEYIESQ